MGREPGYNARKNLDPEVVAQTLRETYGNISLTARKLGVTRQAILYHMEKHEDVKQAHDEASEVLNDIAEGHLAAWVRAGDQKSVRYWLDQKARHRGYGKPIQHEVTGAQGGPIKIEGFDALAALGAIAPKQDDSA
jgi:hypothetical protein